MKTYTLLIFLACLIGSLAQAYVVPTYRDLKPATQVMLERQDFGTPVAASAGYVKSAGYVGPTTTTAVMLTSFQAQPDVPRNIVITPGSTTADVAECTISVIGTNYFGRAISEDFSFAENASTATTGAKAFKTVSSVVFPANCEASPYGASWMIGVGEKIGVKRCMANAGDWVWSQVAGAYEATRATMVVDSNEVEKNTADFNGTMNGSSRFLGFFIQNFSCLP